LLSWAAAAASALFVVLQSLAPSSLSFPVQSATPPPSASRSGSTLPQILRLEVNPSLGQATLRMAPFTSDRSAIALGNTYGMALLASFPAVGDYVFGLPQVRVSGWLTPDTAIVDFPPMATQADIDGFLQSNGLTFQSWLLSDEASGSTAVVALPRVKLDSYDPVTGVIHVLVSAPVRRANIDAWAAANQLVVITYDPATGDVYLQGPKQPPVYRTIQVAAKPKVTPAERKAAAAAARPAAAVKKAAPVAKKAAPAKAKSVASRTVATKSAAKRKTTAAK